MKKLLITTLILFGCATKNTECPKPKKTYQERLEEQSLIYIKKQIDKMAKLTRIQKDLLMSFTKCYRNVLVNPRTVDNLINWQNKLIKNTVSIYCLSFLKQDHKDISPLVEILSNTKIKL